MTEVTADAETLVHHASMTAEQYFRDAIDVIDKAFGKGHAAANSGLVVGFMQACSADLRTAYLKLAAQDIRNGLADIAKAIEGHEARCSP